MTSEAATLASLSDWLELEHASGPLIDRDACMPAVFKDTSNIDRLCEWCKSIPWSAIRTKAKEAMEVALKEAPTEQHQFDSGHYKQGFFEHPWISLSHIVISAGNGCHLCSLILWTAFGQLTEGPFTRSRSTVLEPGEGAYMMPAVPLRSSDQEKQLLLQFSVERSAFGYPIVWQMQHCRFTALQMVFDDDMASSLTNELRRNPTTTSFSQYWLEYCSRTHQSCGEDESVTAQLPRRIIAIDKLDEVLSARLCLADGERARYAALSHRWSSSRSLLLTNSNIEQLRQDISMSELSVTFTEAFELAYSLGLRYIWIDSLCILQDDQHDWAEQSTDMPAIYSNAHVTISAYTSSDGTGSCLGSYSPNLVETPCQVTPGTFLFPFGYPNYPINREGTAQTRGWVMQEEILSRRKIICGVQRVAWTCREMYSSHDKPWAGSVDERDSLQDNIGQGIMPPNAIMDDSAMWQWKELVGDYTLREVTYMKDRLPALSALSRRFGESMSWSAADFLAGIWRQHLPEALLWERKPNRGFDRGKERDRQKARAEMETNERNRPTWSWSSCDGPVTFWYPDTGESCVLREYSMEARCTVIDVQVTAKTSNLYGEVATGSITLECPVLGDFRSYCSRPDSWSNLITWDTKKFIAEPCLLLQINAEAGLVVVEIPGSEVGRQYQRVGVLIGRSELYEEFEGPWKTTIVTVV